MTKRDDPVLRHSRREAVIIGLAWVVATSVTCLCCYAWGYIRPDRPFGKEDLHLTLGMPSWFLWGVITPWMISSLFIFWFAGFYMADDDLGSDHSAELEKDIREEAELHD